MQSTRARIIDLLRGGGASVESITAELGLASATVRRHLDVLLRDGLVEMRAERVPLGRPRFVFTISEDALEGLPGRQFRLVEAVLETILALTPRDTRSRSGREIAALVFDKLAARLLAECLPAVTATSPGERLAQGAKALSAAGLEFDVVTEGGGFVVKGLGCPCTRVLSGREECPHEARILSEMAGVPLRQVGASGPMRREFAVVATRQGVV